MTHNSHFVVFPTQLLRWPDSRESANRSAGPRESLDYHQARKKNPNPKFLVRIFFSGVGVFHGERVGAKKFDTSLETREIKLFGRDIPGFCRDIPGAPEKFEKKKFGFDFRSL